jgi:hypothetical protein
LAFLLAHILADKLKACGIGYTRSAEILHDCAIRVFKTYILNVAKINDHGEKLSGASDGGALVVGVGILN